MLRAISIFLPIFLMFGCASSPLGRSLASEIVVSPFSHQPASPTQLVDQVIAKIGPVRNQTNTQLCVAHAVADVASQYTGRRISAFSVAVRNFQKRRGLDHIFFNPGGVIPSQWTEASRFMLALASSTLQTSLGTTLCEDDQPVNGLSYNDKNLKNLWDAYQFFRAYVGPMAPQQTIDKIKDQLSRVMPSLDNQFFMEKLNRYQPLDEALGRWLDHACSVRIPGNKRVVSTEMGASGNQIVAAIHRALESGSMAVVHYDTRVLQAVEPSVWESFLGFHVSSIVATTSFHNTTHYLLRNSWGSSCAYYAPTIRKRCDRGHIWLTEEEIKKYVTSVSHMENLK